jgi:hypothetical protein
MTLINYWILFWLLQITMLHQSQCKTPCLQHHTLFFSMCGFMCVKIVTDMTSMRNISISLEPGVLLCDRRRLSKY